MGLEANFRFVDDLDSSVGPKFNDPVSAADDHMRGIKDALQGTVGGNASGAQLKLQGTDRFLVSANAATIRAANDEPFLLFENNAGLTVGKMGVQSTTLEMDFENGVEIRPLADRGLRILRGVQSWEFFIQDADNSLQLRDITNNKAAYRFTPNGNLDFFSENQGLRLSVVNAGIVIGGQAEISPATPTDAAHATRKDYVDGLIAGLQTQIDDIKNGYAFTGPISAPTVTQTT